MSSEELNYATSDKPETGSNDDHGFREWVESITVTQDELNTLLIHPHYSLYQAKEHVREGRNTATRPASGVWSLFNELQARYNRGWRNVIKTLRETGHHHHLRGHHHTPG